MGNCYLLQERHARAADAYRRTLAAQPDHVFAWLNLAKACYELKDYDEAGRCFGQAYEVEETKQADHLYFSAAAYLMAGQTSRPYLYLSAS
jgi:tetratricopeptide (TPR) repeat protein